MEGEVTVQTADGKVELATGDYAYFPANYSHTWVTLAQHLLLPKLHTRAGSAS